MKFKQNSIIWLVVGIVVVAILAWVGYHYGGVDDQAQYPIKRTIRYSFTLQNNTNTVKKDVDFRVFGGVEWISDPDRGLGIPFMMQDVYMFLIWSVVYVVVSLLTAAPLAEQVENTTWPNPLGVIFQGRLTGLTDPRLLAGLLLVLMIVLYWIFR